MIYSLTNHYDVEIKIYIEVGANRSVLMVAHKVNVIFMVLIFAETIGCK